MGHRPLTSTLVAAALLLAPALASAQVADPECSDPPPSTTETLLRDLATLPLPEGCPSVDFKALTNRIKNTPHIGLFVKLKLALRAEGVVAEAKEYDENKAPEKLARLRKSYADLLGDFASRLEGKDDELVRDIRCGRDVGFDLLLKGAALENAKNRSGG